jgi:ankyrin repeat protein
MSDLPLIQAAKKGDLQKIRQLLADGHDVNERVQPLTEKGMKAAKWIYNESSIDTAADMMGSMIDVTPLMVAAEEGHDEIVEALLDAGADVNAEDSLKRTAMMIAIRWKQEAIASRLLDAGADPNAKDRSGDPVLSQAIEAQLWTLAHALLDAGANPQPRGKSDYLPLAAASRRGGPAAAPLFHRLLDSGAKPAGSRFLANVVECQQVDVVQRVLQEFPDLASQSSHDWLLELAAKRRDMELILSLLDSDIRPTNGPGGPSPLAGVILGPDRSSAELFTSEHINDPREIACLEALIAGGADVDHLDKRKFVPLGWTILLCRSELCRCLLKHGANRNVNDKGGSLVDYVQTKIEEHRARDYHTAEEQQEQQRRQSELKKILTMLSDHGGVPATQFDGSKTASPQRERPPTRLMQSLDYPTKSVAERRGVCDDGFSKAEQIMVRADIDKIANMFTKDKKFERVERNVFGRLVELREPIGGAVTLVKLKGQDWVYVVGVRHIRGDSPMKAWSKTLKSPVLRAGEQSTAGVVYYWLYDRGERVETFESDGQWFRGGIEIDPEVQDASERMTGTDFSSLRRDSAGVDWSAFESEYEFLDSFLRSENAYLTFFDAYFPGKGKPFLFSAYHKDEMDAAAVERVDLAYYKPTTQQIVAASQPDPKDDPLLQAIKAGDEAAVVTALQAGADVNALPPASDSSYLVIAIGHAFCGHSDRIIELLLEAGADPNFGGHDPALCRVANWSGSDLLIMRVMQRLIEAGADVNARGREREPNPFLPSGETPLMIVARSAKLNYVKLLLRYDADASITNSAGQTALYYAEIWLRAVRSGRLKDVPHYSEDDEAQARATVELLESIAEGTFDPASLPPIDEIIAAEAARLG